MAKTSRFFLSRIIKTGTLTPLGVADAIRQSVSVESRAYAWTIVDVVEGEITVKRRQYSYLAGKLVKYDPNAIVEVIDEQTRAVRLRPEPNLQRASSLFAYVPGEAVVGHQGVWNQIRPRDFRIQFAQLILAYHRHFFVDCSLQPISDLKQFISKLSELEVVVELRARVSPPNPLFGRYWANLDRYLRERRLRQLSINEKAAGESLRTEAPEIARQIGASLEEKSSSAPIGDAAILMAADGYGTAEISGVRNSCLEVVSTEQNAIQLKLPAETSHEELARAVIQEILRVNRGRKLRHR